MNLIILRQALHKILNFSFICINEIFYSSDSYYCSFFQLTQTGKTVFLNFSYLMQILKKKHFWDNEIQ